MDDRALANNIALFFATIIMGFLLYVIVEPVVTPLMATAGEYTSRQASTAGQNYISNALEASPYIVVALGALQLVVAAVYQTRVVGR